MEPTSQSTYRDDNKLVHAYNTFVEVLQAERTVLEQFLTILPRNQVISVFEVLLTCKGKIVVMGVGKSGIVGRKIASTLASTGSPAIFLHASECAHGDLGIITSRDVVWMLSNSGRTAELLTLLPYVVEHKIPLVAMVGNADSELALVARGSCLVLGNIREADEENVVPTCSTTLMLAIGDAIAIALMRSKGISQKHFAVWHPGGWLGKRLNTKVKHVMHGRDSCPLVAPSLMLRKALHHMTRMRLGCLVSQVGPNAYAIFTDGDLRRVLEGNQGEILDQPLSDFLHTSPVVVGEDVYVSEALHLLESKKITQLIVLDANQEYVGVLHIHDVLEFRQV